MGTQQNPERDHWIEKWVGHLGSLGRRGCRNWVSEVSRSQTCCDMYMRLESVHVTKSRLLQVLIRISPQVFEAYIGRTCCCMQMFRPRKCAVDNTWALRGSLGVAACAPPFNAIRFGQKPDRSGEIFRKLELGQNQRTGRPRVVSDLGSDCVVPLEQQAEGKAKRWASIRKRSSFDDLRDQPLPP